MNLAAINLAQALTQFQDTWAPRTIARVNDYDVRLVKTKGAFDWHAHPETDELFLVVTGTLQISLEAGTVRLEAGEMYVVPRGVRHRPWSDEGAEVLLFEPSTVVNTGDSPSALTAPRRELG
jgi:mannose-6-phosphate isomerase-like protein (cupin superfamily)